MAARRAPRQKNSRSGGRAPPCRRAQRAGREVEERHQSVGTGSGRTERGRQRCCRDIAADALEQHLGTDQAHRQSDARNRRSTDEVEALHLLAHVARAEHRALPQGVGRAERGAAPGVQLVGEVGRADRATNRDAGCEVVDAGPLRDLRDHDVRERLDRGITLTADAALAEAHVGGERHEHEEVLLPVGRDAGIDAARLADVERCGLGHVLVRPEDRLEAAAPVPGEEQRVVLELGQLAARRRGRAGARSGPASPYPSTPAGRSAARAAGAASRCGAGRRRRPRCRPRWCATSSWHPCTRRRPRHRPRPRSAARGRSGRWSRPRRRRGPRCSR